MAPSTPESTSALRAHLWVFAAYSALTVLLTWPLAAQVTSIVPSDVGDPILNTWILWWNATQVPLTDAWWNAPAFFPATGAFAFSEHLLGLTVISSPVIWLSGNPQLGYNVTFLLTFPLSAMAAYLLGLELTGRRDAAFLGGLAFGFAPYRIAHFPHLQILASYWMPLALLGLHRHLRLGGMRWLALFGGAWLMQSLSNGYYLAYFSVLIGLWVLWFVPWRDWRQLVRIAAVWIAAMTPLVPILLGYRATHDAFGLTRRIETIRSLGADVTSWLDASPLLSLWGGLSVYHRAEGELFTGLTVVVVIALGMADAFRARPSADARLRAFSGRSLLGFYVLAAVAMFSLALGPSPTYLGTPFMDTGPYAWLLHVPGFDSLRVPARFAMIMIVCLSAAVSIGFARFASTWSRVRRLSVAGVLAVGIVAESWIGAMPLWDMPRAWDIEASEISGALLVLPVLNELNDAASMYRAMAHGRPLVNGYSGHRPPWYRTLKEGLDLRDPAMLDQLALAGVTQIAIVSRNDREDLWAEYVLTRATQMRAATDGAYVLYDLPSPGARLARTFDRTLPVTVVEVSGNSQMMPALTDDDLDTRWHSTGPQAGAEYLLLDLGAVQPVSAVELSLGRHTFDHPRELVVEVSVNRSDWTEVWRGHGAPPAITGGFLAPGRMPLLLDLGDQVTRFVRIRQIGRHDTAYWSIAELEVQAASR